MRSANSDRPPYGPDHKGATGSTSVASARERRWEGTLICNGTPYGDVLVKGCICFAKRAARC